MKLTIALSAKCLHSIPLHFRTAQAQMLGCLVGLDLSKGK